MLFIQTNKKTGGLMTIDDAKILLEAIHDSKFRGNKWEENFILSIEGWVDDNKKLTEGQSNMLQSIYRKSQQ
jgi:hypothetical protein